MPLLKPLKRTRRPFIDNPYLEKFNYILHPEFAIDPQHYVQSFLLIQQDLQTLFQYVEPTKQNLEKTISLKIHELLVRACIEVEANFTAILRENNYQNSNENPDVSRKWSLSNDYCLLEYSHKLSLYEVRFPLWRGEHALWQPFAGWVSKPTENWHVLDWYQIYNKSKHDRHGNFEKATFGVLLNPISGLVVLLSAQFGWESFSTELKSLADGPKSSYDYQPEFDQAVGGYFRVRYPDEHWKENERYGFNWDELGNTTNPVATFDYDKLKHEYIQSTRS